jgi:uncharacterized membrane protein YphA (DoxX/SURF4 family)
MAHLIEDVRGSKVYPASGPLPPGDAKIIPPAAFGHPELIPPRWTNEAVENAALLAGRIIFGGYFLYSGINHFLKRDMMAGYAGAKGVPSPDAAVTTSGAMAALGGLSLLTGTRPKVGAGLIAAFLLGVSGVHRFWEEQDPQQRMQETVNFMKNMALVGGALLAAARPEPWPYSVTVHRGGALMKVPTA